jgi:hypothetical protein
MSVEEFTLLIIPAIHGAEFRFRNTREAPDHVGVVANSVQPLTPLLVHITYSRYLSKCFNGQFGELSPDVSI